MGELAIEIKGLLQEIVEKTALTLVPSKLMTAQQVAALLEIGDDTFAKIRVSAGFPAPVMIGEGDRCRRWKKADIDNKKPPEGCYLHPISFLWLGQ